MTNKRSSTSENHAFWIEYRHEMVFLGIFVLLLGGSFTLISVNSINDHVIEPFTASIAQLSGKILNLLGQGIEMQETVIRSKRFAVNIRNGCNGVEAMLIFLAAVIAFPAPRRAKLIGLALGFVAIQAVNLVRVVALFLTGVYAPRLFDSSHTVVWQTIVVGFSVVLWILWASIFVPSKPSAS